MRSVRLWCSVALVALALGALSSASASAATSPVSHPPVLPVLVGLLIAAALLGLRPDWWDAWSDAYAGLTRDSRLRRWRARLQGAPPRVTIIA